MISILKFMVASMLRPVVLAVTLSLIVCARTSLAAQTGLLVVAHGANPGWNAAVRQTVAQVVWSKGPVATAFLMGAEAELSGWDAGVSALEGAGARSIVVVPLMVSSAGAHARQIAHYAGALASLPAELAGHVHERPALPAVLTRVTAALDGAPELSARLAEIWTGLPRVDRRRSMMYVAHGPSSDADAARWLDDLRRAIAPTAAAAGVPFDVGLLRDDAEPAIRAAAVEDSRTKILALAAETGDSVTVLPVLVSTGRIATATIPRDLVGLPIRYVPTPLTPSAHIARWIERVALARAEAPQ